MSDLYQKLDQLLKVYDKDNEYVYVLKLRDDKYYIGKSNDYPKRILKQFGDIPGNTTVWTLMYKPIDLLELLPVGNDPNLERDKTLEYMRLYGWQNVRGYSWVKVVMKNPPKLL
jgi:hypothetical protein